MERRLHDGFFNATLMCKGFGKLYANYAKADHAQNYQDALAKALIEGTIPYLATSSP